MHAFDRRSDRQTDRKAFAIPCVALILLAVARQKVKANDLGQPEDIIAVK